MKTIASIVLIFFSVFFSYGQGQLKLSIVKGTENPNTEKEHLYLLEVTNKGNQVSTFNVTASNASCNNERVKQVELNQEVLDKHKTKKIQTINVQPGKSVEFYVKITRPNNTKQNSWNCTEIKAVSNDGNVLSNIITIESLIPNPNDVN